MGTVHGHPTDTLGRARVLARAAALLAAALDPSVPVTQTARRVRLSRRGSPHDGRPRSPRPAPPARRACPTARRAPGRPPLVLAAGARTMARPSHGAACPSRARRRRATRELTAESE